MQLPHLENNILTIEYIIRLLVDSAPPAPITNLDTETWDDIAITAIALGLAPLLHWRLEPSSLNPPPLTLAKLGVTRQAHAKRNAAIAEQLAEILAACAGQNIPVMVLKGAVLAPLAYPHPALRPMNDIDLLFQPDDVLRVGALLEGLGYRGKYKDARQGPGITKHLATYRRDNANGATPNPYLSAAADRTVEPHVSLEESWFGLKVDITPGVWQRAVAITLHGQPASRLSASDMLLHLAVHATFHVIMGASVFVQLYDIGRVIQSWPDELDWNQILDLTGQAGAQPFAYAALYWAKTLYQAPVPAGPLQQLKAACPPDLIHYIHGLTASGLFRRTQQPPLKTVGQRLKKGLADRRETARWAGSLRAKWRIWQTALAFYKTDTASLLVGRKLKAEV